MAAEMTWLDYYQAVKRGDLQVVKTAANKDFRITLTMDKSALELAALFGHLNLVESFLGDCDKSKDFELLSMALKDGLRSGNFQISKLLWDFIEDKKNMTGDFVLPAIDGKNLLCLDLVYHIQVKNKSTREDYIRKAFQVGWLEGMKFIERAENMVGTLIYEAMTYADALPRVYVDVALNNMENVIEKIQQPKTTTNNKTRHEWYDKNYFKLDPTSTMALSQVKFTFWSIFEIAAHFGHLDILTYLIEECVKLNVGEYFNLKQELKSVFTFALRNNQTHILQYLISSGLVKPRPPSEYQGFKVNDAFFYLKKETRRCCRGESVKGNIVNCMKVICPYEDSPTICKARADWTDSTPAAFRGIRRYEAPFGYGYNSWQQDRSASRLAKVEDFYDEILDYIDEYDLTYDYAHYFMLALSNQNVGAALSFKKRMTKNTKCSTWMYHTLFTQAIGFGKVEKGSVVELDYSVMPSPVVVELLLWTLERATCDCGLLKPMSLFLVTERLDLPRPFGHIERIKTNRTTGEEDQQLPLALWTERAEAVMEVLTDHGVNKPTNEMVGDEMMELAFAEDQPVSSVYAGRLLAAMHCLDPCHFGFETHYCNRDWFTEDWARRDEFLTKLLIACCGSSGMSVVLIDGFLIYLRRPKARKDHFLYCIEQTRVSAQDGSIESYIEYNIEELEDSTEFEDEYNEYKNIYDFCYSYSEKHHYLLSERMLSLQSLARLSIYKQCVTVAHQNEKYISSQKLVRIVGESLPKPVSDFLVFSDVYEKLDPNVKTLGIDEAVVSVLDRVFNSWRS